MKQITVDDIMSWGPCKEYSMRRIKLRDWIPPNGTDWLMDRLNVILTCGDDGGPYRREGDRWLLANYHIWAHMEGPDTLVLTWHSPCPFIHAFADYVAAMFGEVK